MGPLISGKSRLVKYYSIWPEQSLCQGNLVSVLQTMMSHQKTIDQLHLAIFSNHFPYEGLVIPITLSSCAARMA